ncbi:Uncharacterised protein (plasmid) [Tsukamurella tyrosinosolvens]|uniref:Uncharacterized protein n=1 Tax=Tsukamurella tyrosinosolvens TaxID=57704 RepID=A0A1H4UWB1_TSUTY|nr:hypothetical protein [Tsukamurella tyrosinosolvens]KXO98404.1 hypothetical protein AXK58_25360 [Tsukamurella tyrosinosolvens]SEC73006.1 hypothetical protein SAMN04489793_3060 [Tsukamurella tyrosinosolvens]VEH90841.1 Uncharacterised protein [Tsukamurella tyrosinosolvens]
MAVNVWALMVGDKVREAGKDYDLIVWLIEAPMSAGRAEHWGPSVYAHIRPGGYGVTFDAMNADRFAPAGG